MPSLYVRLINILICLTLFLCASCITTTAPNKAQVKDQQRPVASRQSTRQSVDNKIVDTWELLYQINDKGDQQLPRDNVRTLIEFTDRGQVIMNRIDKGASSPQVTSKSGNYVLRENELNITDNVGRSVRWPYRITGDSLVISMPEEKKKFYLRRYR
jgi:hypothetical protein